MTTPATTIGLSDVNVELTFSSTAVIGLNDSPVRSLAAVPSGTITLQNLQSKTSLFTFNLTTSSNVDFRTAALAAGWNGTATLKGTLLSGNTISSSSTGSYALTISGSFPGGVTFINNGKVIGRGGDGGSASATALPGSAGGAGGNAIYVTVATSIDNTSGLIYGGGGGGGGGGRGSGYNKGGAGSAGGGGGGGIGVSAAGTTAGSFPGTNGTAGTLTSAGSGGAGGNNTFSGAGGSGGAGGTYGTAGTAGQSVATAGGAGGTAGYYLQGNTNITWIATGTRAGLVS